MPTWAKFYSDSLLFEIEPIETGTFTFILQGIDDGATAAEVSFKIFVFDTYPIALKKVRDLNVHVDDNLEYLLEDDIFQSNLKLSYKLFVSYNINGEDM